MGKEICSLVTPSVAASFCSLQAVSPSITASSIMAAIVKIFFILLVIIVQFLPKSLFGMQCNSRQKP
jgi:hypothetical protein